MPAFILTAEPVNNSTAGTINQDLRLALDVGENNELDIALRLLGGNTNSTNYINIITGMQNQTEDGWVVLGTFSQSLTGPTTSKSTMTGPLRYIRWQLVNPATSQNYTFFISGVARRV